MKFSPLIFILGFLALAGCASDDRRLHGTWYSNREATVAAAFEHDPRWTNAPPDRVERFRDIFGHLTLTYSNGVMSSQFRGKDDEASRYRVVRRGDDYVIIHFDAPLEQGRDIRIRFVEEVEAIGFRHLLGLMSDLIEWRSDDHDT